MIPLKDSQSTNIFPLVTVGLIGINVWAFLQEITSTNPDAFIDKWALIPAYLNFSHPATLLPLITSQFLHAGFLHIASNMLFLWVFGDNVEEYLGRMRFLAFYLAVGIIGGLAQSVVAPDTTIPMIGASGAVAGVLGAYAAKFSHHKIKTLVPIVIFLTVLDIPAGFMLLYWFATQVIAGVGSFGSDASLGGVAYLAHIAGFITGWVYAKTVAPSTSAQRLNFLGYS